MRSLTTYLSSALLMCSIILGASCTRAATSAYDFTFEKIDGGALPLSQFKGKTVLVVNTASRCGFTPQYEQLESVWKDKRDKGLVIVGVPSNDFGGQEPGTAKEIKEFCEGNYHVDFPLAAKVKVTGDEAHPFYKWASADKGAPKWNFHKYLLNGKGELVAAFTSQSRPDSPEVLAAIDASLKAK